MMLSFTIYKSKSKIIVETNTIYRDVFLYGFITILTILIALTDDIYWYEAVSYIFIYIIFVLIVYK